MVITPEEIERRRKFLGASDTGAILGLSPFKSPVDCWYSKCRHGGSPAGKAAQRGNALEPSVIAWAESELGLERGRIEVDKRFVRHHEVATDSGDAPVPFASNLDGLYYDDEGRLINVEAKTAKFDSDWGAAGTDEVPVYYLTQVCHQMWTSGAVLTYIPVLFGGLDFRMYRVERNETLINNIVDRCAEWWRKYVITDTRPEGPPPKLEILKALPRDREEVAEITEEHVRMARLRERLRKERLELTKQEKELTSTLIEALGSAEVGVHDDGHLLYVPDKAGRRTLHWREESYDGHGEA